MAEAPSRRCSSARSKSVVAYVCRRSSTNRDTAPFAFRCYRHEIPQNLQGVQSTFLIVVLPGQQCMIVTGLHACGCLRQARNQPGQPLLRSGRIGGEQCLQAVIDQPVSRSCGGPTGPSHFVAGIVFLLGRGRIPLCQGQGMAHSLSIPAFNKRTIRTDIIGEKRKAIQRRALRVQCKSEAGIVQNGFCGLQTR